MTAHEKAVKAAKQAIHPLMDEAESTTAAITAYLTSMQEQGWVMVPKTPSEEMLIRGGNKYDDPYSAMQEDVIAAGLVYRAMIDAAMLEAAKDAQP
jgi:hypothetical protein